MIDATRRAPTTIRVVEQFVEAKTADRTCEDVIVLTDDFVAVIDGASDATGAQFAGKSGGLLAAESIADAMAALPREATARTFADALSEAVASAAGDLDDDTRWPVAVVTCISAERREVWRIGDCNVSVDGVEYPSTFRVNDAAYSFRAAVNAALLRKGTPLEEILASDPGARGARLLIDNQQHLANSVGPWGFGCVNGRAIPNEFIEVFAVPDRPTEVILTSDGYPTVHPTLRETETALTRLIKADPAAISELWTIGKATKPGANAPDDRAYLRCIVG